MDISEKRTPKGKKLAVVVAMAIALQGGIVNAQETKEDINLAEANVMEVEYSRSEDGKAYRFDVTLYHDDDGEEGYANWWQVENLDGKMLGRRELLHAHGTREFTRSETINVPEGTEYMVVRGHDETHGFGGKAAIINLNKEKIEFVDQGDEPRDFTGYTRTRNSE
ncbi:MAG: hypothetical protein ACQER7_05120 [Bacteroidota bacterium]